MAVSINDITNKLKQTKGITPLIKKVLLLRILLIDGDTPKWVKAICMAALAYFVLVTDAIPDPIFIDDIAILAAAITSLNSVIKPHHHSQVDEQLNS
jgi:uncharacterized membrane protein YkvA (DUF1232 family)